MVIFSQEIKGEKRGFVNVEPRGDLARCEMKAVFVSHSRKLVEIKDGFLIEVVDAILNPKGGIISYGDGMILCISHVFNHPGIVSIVWGTRGGTVAGRLYFKIQELLEQIAPLRVAEYEASL